MKLCEYDNSYTLKDHKVGFCQRVLAVGRCSSRNLRCYANVPTLLLVSCLIAISLNVYQTRRLSAELSLVSKRNTMCSSSASHPQYNKLIRSKQVWIKASHLETGYLKHVTAVLQSIGYSLDGGTYSDWDLLWSHEYPFSDANTKQLLINLKPHQKVNKWPGSGYVTSKVTLATSPLKHVPKAFQLPAEESKFKAYAKEYPEKLWVQKSNKHRGVKITPIDGLDLSASNTFVQEFVEKPLLINKRKFDIGIYTIITSIEPLRIYIVDHEFLLRFCSHDYHPFDAADREKYVVTDSYTPIWEIPQLNQYYKSGFTAKQSLRQYIIDLGRDPANLFAQIEASVAEVYLAKLSKMRESLQSYNHNNFFEMVRFDFVVDEDMELYLMEVNMSPNLSSKHFSANRLLYEQVVFNTLHLIGLASTIDHHSKLDINSREMVSGPKDLSVQPAQCATQCSNSCESATCRLCYHCMTDSDRQLYYTAFTEHMNKRNTKRVMPPTLNPANPKALPDYWESLSQVDRDMHMWFAGKCEMDHSWC